MSRVISSRDVEAAAAAGQERLDVQPGSIVTPSAKDRARELGIAVGEALGNGHSMQASGASQPMAPEAAGRWVRPSSAETLPPAPVRAKQIDTSKPGYAMADKPNYFASPAIDNLYTISMELGAALWVVKDRLRVIEELLERAGIVSEQMVEQYAPDPERRKEIIAQRNAFIEKIYGIIKDNPG